MRIMLYSLLWVMQDLYHQPYQTHTRSSVRVQGVALPGFGGSEGSVLLRVFGD